ERHASAHFPRSGWRYIFTPETDSCGRQKSPLQAPTTSGCAPKNMLPPSCSRDREEEMRVLIAATFALGIILSAGGSAMAQNGRTLVAGVGTPGQATNMTKIPSLVRNAACSKDCGATSGSANCTANQTCDCACNRQPICQCR